MTKVREFCAPRCTTPSVTTAPTPVTTNPPCCFIQTSQVRDPRRFTVCGCQRTRPLRPIRTAPGAYSISCCIPPSGLAWRCATINPLPTQAVLWWDPTFPALRPATGTSSIAPTRPTRITSASIPERGSWRCNFIPRAGSTVATRPNGAPRSTSTACPRT